MTSASHTRILIVDDEPLARQRIEDLLAHEPGAEIVGTAGDGTAAVEAIRRLRPDIVFLDVQMPAMTGLDVARTIGPAHMPVTVFVTAYDQHALQAFDLAAVDYLVKPFDDERFEQSFQRARRLATLEDSHHLQERLLAVLREATTLAPARAASAAPPDLSPARLAAPAPASPPKPQPDYLERIAVESRGKVKFVPVAEIDYIGASGPYAELVVGQRRHLIREPMHALEERLDPARFFRIHRSAIVQLDRVDTLHRGAGGDYEVQLRDGTRLRVSRSRREQLEARLGRIG